MLPARLGDHAHGSLLHFRGKLHGGLHGSILSRGRASTKPGAVQIVDNHRIHKTKAVQKFVAETAGKLELHYAPKYAPKLNPDELVWNDVKTHGLDRLSFTNKEEMKRLIEEHFRRLQTLPNKIKSFFHGKPREYIGRSGLLLTV